MTTYTTIKHPTSGEAYAVELDDDGAILRAAGPLHHTEDGDTDDEENILDADGLRDYIGNAALWGEDATECADDITQALRRERGEG